MKNCIFITINLFLLTAAQNTNFKHPHEQNAFDDRLVEQFKKIQDIRQSNIDTVPYYHRLVKNLFRKQRFRADPSSDDYFIANIPIKINKQQYELLVNSDIMGLNINEIDGLVEEVMKQSNNDDWQHSITTILYEHYRQELIDSVTSFSSPILWIILSLITLIILNQIYKFSRFKFVTILFMSLLIICGISFYMTYSDCMHDLEVEQIMLLSKDKIKDNPCKQYQEESNNFWSSMQTWFAGSKKNECKEYMKKTLLSSPSTKYCNPLEVLFKWFAKLHMSYFGSIFKEFTDFFAETTSSMDFFNRTLSKVLYLAFFAISFIFILVMFLKYVVQSVPSYISHAVSSSNNNHAQDPSITALLHEIRQENAEMKRELSVIRERSEEPKSLPPNKKKPKLSALKEAISSRSDESSDSN